MHARLMLNQVESIAQIGTWICELDTHTWTFSPGFMRLHGLTQPVATGLCELCALAHPDDRPTIEAALAAVMAGAPSRELEYRIVRKDTGAVRHMQMRCEVGNDPASTRVALYGVVQDITERREQELQRAQLAAIVASAHVAILSTDLQTNVVSWNQGAEDLFGYTAAEAVGQPLGLLIAPDEVNAVAYNADQIRSDVVISNLEVKRRTKDGREIDIVATISPVRNAAGEIVGTSSIAHDLSNQKVVEQALREREDELCAMLENSADLLWAIDTEYRLVMFNTAFRKAALKSLQRECTVGECVLAGKIPEALRTYWKNLYDRALSGEQFSVEINNESAGERSFRDDRFNPIRNRQGTIVGVVIAGRDITQRKHAEEALRVNLTKYAVLFESSPVGISITDDAGRILESNDEAQRLLGVSKAEHERRAYDGPEWRIVRTDGTPMPACEYASVRALQEQRHIANVEMGIVKEQGEVTWISVTAAPIPLPHYGVVITYTDINERKATVDALRRSEVLFRTLAQLVPVGLYITDAQGNCRYANEAWLEMAGLSLDDALGAGWVQGLHPDDRAAVTAAWQDMVATNGDWQQEYRFQTPNGKTTWVLGLAKPLHDGPDLVAGYVGANMDITEHRGAEAALRALNLALEERVAQRTEQLELANAELRRADQMKDEFLAAMSHELRTPLAGIMTITEALELQTLGKLTERQLHYVQLVRQNGERLLEMVTSILHYTALVSGRMPLRREPCALVELCAIALHKLRDRAAAKHLVMHFKSAPEHISIWSDPESIIQILHNLLDNAIKFTPDHGDIGVIMSQEADDTVRIVVWDTGIGIAGEQQARLFRPFTQLDSALNRQYEGIGLGLAYVHELVNRLNGEIQVESTPGHGSRFTVVLPSTAQRLRN